MKLALIFPTLFMLLTQKIELSSNSGLCYVSATVLFMVPKEQNSYNLFSLLLIPWNLAISHPFLFYHLGLGYYFSPTLLYSFQFVSILSPRVSFM